MSAQTRWRRLFGVVPRTPSCTWLTHPMEVAFGLMFVFVGLSLATAGFTFQPVGVPRALPEPIVMAWSICLLLGGICILIGLWLEGENGPTGRLIERAGCYLVMPVWVSYAMVVVVLSPRTSLVAISLSVAITTGLIGRTVALMQVDKVVQHVASIAARDEVQ